MNRLNTATPAFYINRQEFSANNISTNLFCVSIQTRFCLFPAFISSQKSLVVSWQSFLSSFSPFPEAFSADYVENTESEFRSMEDDFALRYVRIYPVVNSRTELVTLAPGLRPEQLGDNNNILSHMAFH